MKANEKTLSSKQEKLDELHAQQAKLRELQSELDVIESKLKNNQKLSKEDIKYTSQLGWLAAAAASIAAIAASV